MLLIFKCRWRWRALEGSVLPLFHMPQGPFKMCQRWGISYFIPFFFLILETEKRSKEDTLQILLGRKWSWLVSEERTQRSRHELRPMIVGKCCTQIHEEPQIFPTRNTLCRCQLVFRWMTASVRGAIIEPLPRQLPVTRTWTRRKRWMSLWILIQAAPSNLWTCLFLGLPDGRGDVKVDYKGGKKEVEELRTKKGRSWRRWGEWQHEPLLLQIFFFFSRLKGTMVKESMCLATVQWDGGAA